MEQMTNSNRRKRFWKVVIGIGLACLAIPPILGTISLRLMGTDPELDSVGTLSWSNDLGELPASKKTPVSVPTPPIRSSFVFSRILSVEDAVQWKGGWIVLDGRSGAIHLLSSDRGLVGTLGREGQGPGEFQDPVALAVGDSSLWVLNHHGLELDRYSHSGDPGVAQFHSRRKLTGGGCLAGLAKALVTTSGTGPAILRVCPATLPGPGTAWVESVQDDGTLSPVLTLPLGTPGSRRLHLMRQPVLTAGTGHLFLGTWDAPCMATFGRNGEERDHLCLPEYDRPPTPEGKRAGLERRLGWVSDLGLLPMDVPAHLPWYDRAFATPGGLVFRRVRTEEERDLVLVTPDGAISVTDGWFPENTFVGSTEILVAQDLPQGAKIQIYPSPWR